MPFDHFGLSRSGEHPIALASEVKRGFQSDSSACSSHQCRLHFATIARGRSGFAPLTLSLKNGAARSFRSEERRAAGFYLKRIVNSTEVIRMSFQRTSKNRSANIMSAPFCFLDFCDQARSRSPQESLFQWIRWMHWCCTDYTRLIVLLLSVLRIQVRH
jgi:hypothetical protein